MLTRIAALQANVFERLSAVNKYSGRAACNLSEPPQVYTGMVRLAGWARAFVSLAAMAKGAIYA